MIKSLLKEGYTLSENRSASCPRYRIVKPQGTIKNEYIHEIKRLKLNVHGNYKFIGDSEGGSLIGYLDLDGVDSKSINSAKKAVSKTAVPKQYYERGYTHYGKS